MKHPLQKFGKKNRNVISGILVAIASIYAVARYFNVPQSQINTFFISAVLLLVFIMLAAIVTVVLFKTIQKVFKLFNKH